MKISISDNRNTSTLYYPLPNNRSKIVFQYFGRDSLLFKEDKEINTIKLNACSFALHEIGHYIITPKQRRRKKDYGIPANAKNNFKYDLEEVKATMIENELRRLFGFSFKKDLFKGSNVDRDFILDNKKKIMQWWEAEGKIITKTYADLV